MTSLADHHKLAETAERIRTSFTYRKPFILSEHQGLIGVDLGDNAPRVLFDSDEPYGVKLFTNEGDDDWNVIYDMSAQESYHGASMHPSEFIGVAFVKEMLRLTTGDPQVFIVLPVHNDAPGSWCVVHRAI